MEDTSNPDRLDIILHTAKFLHTEFLALDNPDTLQDCINLSLVTLGASKPRSEQQANAFHQLGMATISRFRQQGAMSDVRRAVDLYRAALQLRKVAGPERGAVLRGLASCLHDLFEQESSMDVLEEAISLSREATDLQESDVATRAMSMSGLGIELLSRYEVLGSIDDLVESIQLHQTALNILEPVPNHKARLGPLGELANGLLARYRKFGNPEDLDGCIAMEREVVRLRQGTPGALIFSVNNLASSLAARLFLRGRPADLDECVALHQQAVDLSTPEHPDHAMFIGNLANDYSLRYQSFGQQQDLDECIRLHRYALALRSDNHSARSKALSNLANGLLLRYEQFGQPTDLDECITLHRELLSIGNEENVFRSMDLNNLANSLFSRHESRGDQRDLEECIKLHEGALELRPPGHPDRVSSLNNLANALRARHTQAGSHLDLEKSISLLREAVQLHASRHSEQAITLSNLANSLLSLYESKGVSQDLEECITLHREALTLRPGRHLERVKSMNNVASGLFIRHQHFGLMVDLDECISLYQDALSIQHMGDPARASTMNNLAVALLARHAKTGAVEALHQGIGLHRDALSLRGLDHPDRASSLRNLALAILTRYEETGQMDDIDESISLFRKDVEARLAGHRHRADSLNNLANGLFARYERRLATSDLQEYLVIAQEALGLRDDGDPNRGTSLSALASGLEARFLAESDPNDLDRCIALHREALQIRKPGHERRPSTLMSLGAALRRRSQLRHDYEDVNECIACHREEVNILQENPVHHSRALSHLAEALMKRYSYKQDESDLLKAIELLQLATSQVQPADPRRSFALCDLAHALCTKQLREWRRHEHTPDTDLTSALSLLEEALTDQVPDSKLLMNHASMALHVLTDTASWIPELELRSKVLDLYVRVLRLLPLVVSLELDVRSRLEALRRTSIMTRPAILYAIRLREVNVAVELLEEGRATFWTQALRLRSTFDDLPPEIQERLKGVLQQLRVADRESELAQPQMLAIDAEAKALNRRQLNREYLGIVQKLESQGTPGFVSAPRGSRFAFLSQAARKGPVVVLIEGRNCHAIIIKDDGGDAIDVLLKSIDATQLIELAASVRDDNLKRAAERGVKTTKTDRFAGRGMRQLKELWEVIVYPIISTLNLKKRSSGETDGQRIFWCTTGAFNFLPIHAAGRYTERPTRSCSDYAVSSYTPTISALINAQKEIDQLSLRDAAALLIAVPSAPRQPFLSYAREETSIIAGLARPGSVLLSEKESDTLAAVAEHLPKANILHLACHGEQHDKSPLESGFWLRDGRLTIAKLTEYILKNALFAYCSACETAKGDMELRDQTVHLAAAMLFVGFRSVIGTMWSINDEDGPRIAQAVYTRLFQTEYLDLDAIPFALDAAVSKLRQEGAPPSRWVPYIHMGR